MKSIRNYRLLNCCLLIGLLFYQSVDNIYGEEINGNIVTDNGQTFIESHQDEPAEDQPFLKMDTGCGEEVESNIVTDNDKTILEYLKGESTEDQLFLGMATFHFDSESRSKRNWNQNLIGFQYNDFIVWTFENSFYNRTWAAGMSRNLLTTDLSDHWDMTLGYRIGLAYGYEDGEAPFSSASPIIPIVAIFNQYNFQEHYGIELLLTTSISVCLFYQF